MRHDAERPRSTSFLSEATVPGCWAPVRAEMQANAFTHLTLEEVRAEAAAVLIVAPSADVARACFGEMLDTFAPRTDKRADVQAGSAGGSDAAARAGSAGGSDARTESAARSDAPPVEVIGLDELVPERVPAGTWVFLPHRQDGWTELEEASERLHRALVRENADREADDRLTLIEFGINMWLWAEPPSSGGDPVCHAGELISWESAWALAGMNSDGGVPEGQVPDDDCGSSEPSGVAEKASAPGGGRASARPPIYFGLPRVLRKRRWDG